MLIPLLPSVLQIIRQVEEELATTHRLDRLATQNYYAILDPILTYLNGIDLDESLDMARERVRTLYGKCKSLQVNDDVLTIKSHAERLEEESTSISADALHKRLQKIQEQVDRLIANERLSIQNNRLIRAARQILCNIGTSLSENMPLESKRKVVPLSSIEFDQLSETQRHLLALQLYEIAQHIYFRHQEQIEAFIENLSPFAMSLLTRQLALMGCLSSPLDPKIYSHAAADARMKVIQVVIGLANELCDSSHRISPVPTFEEIDQMFMDSTELDAN